MNNFPSFQNYTNANLRKLLSLIGRPIIISDNEYLCIEHDGAFIIAGDSAVPKIGAAVNFGGANLRIREVRVNFGCIQFIAR